MNLPSLDEAIERGASAYGRWDGRIPDTVKETVYDILRAAGYEDLRTEVERLRVAEAEAMLVLESVEFRLGKALALADQLAEALEHIESFTGHDPEHDECHSCEVRHMARAALAPHRASKEEQ